MSDKSRYRLRHRGLRTPLSPRPTAQGALPLVIPPAYGIQGHTAYGTSFSPFSYFSYFKPSPFFYLFKHLLCFHISFLFILYIYLYTPFIYSFF